MAHLTKSLVDIGVLEGSYLGPLLVVDLLLCLNGSLQGTADGD